MNKYEMIFIVDARLPDAGKGEISKQVTDLAGRCGGTVADCAVWMERHRMAFAVDKASEGTYYLMHFEMPGGEVAKFRRELMINERLLRFLIVRPEEPKVKKA